MLNTDISSQIFLGIVSIFSNFFCIFACSALWRKSQKKASLLEGLLELSASACNLFDVNRLYSFSYRLVGLAWPF